jgi:hypothetical protein
VAGAHKKRNAPPSPLKYLAIPMHEPAWQRARDMANTPGFANAQQQGKKVEALFAELKNQIGLRRLRLRRMKFVREQFFLAAPPIKSSAWSDSSTKNHRRRSRPQLSSPPQQTPSPRYSLPTAAPKQPFFNT